MRMMGSRTSLQFDWRLVRLPNGLRLITISRPDTPTVAVRVYVRAGSRYDEPPFLGLAHCTEHMLFKGTQSRSPREIYACVERLGGVLDAGTTKQYMTVYAVTPGDGLMTALDVVAKVLTEPALREDDFWAEKLVLLEEIQRAEDQQSVIFDLFAETLWPAHPLRQRMRGTLEGLYNLDHESLLSFFQRRYVTGNLLLAVCGDIEHREVQQLVSDGFAALPDGPECLPLAVEEPQLDGKRTAHLEKGVQQMCLLMGVPTVSMKHGDRSALRVLERVLGMGGSARLHQHLREEKQLVYSVNTVTAHYEDVGYFAVHTVCDPQKVSEVRQAILEEWDRLRCHGVTEVELRDAKSNYAGAQALRAETNLALASIFGTQGLLHRVETSEEAIARINAVRREDVLRVAQQYLDTERYVAVTVGREP
jgi:predicted Zn-dependent peptidase